MNLFVLGTGEGARLAAAERALRDLLGSLPFLPGRPVESWEAPSGRAAAAWVQHGEEQTGGVRYAATERERIALWSGRPIRWTGAAAADGRAPLDARAYLAPAGDWAEDLDGRAVVARYDDAGGEVEVWSDPMGAYPVFSAAADGARWVSNSPDLLRRLAGARDAEPAVLASLLGGGWSLTGDPVWRGIERLDRGAVHAVTAAGVERRLELLPLERIVSLPGAGFDAAEAAAVLVATLSALADWPGRPSAVPVTGGRDSRLVLAAALRAGIPFEATTGGPRGHPDVEVARALCEVAGIEHVPLAGDPHGDMWTAPRRAAGLVELAAAGTACVSDGAGFPLGPLPGPPVLWHSGQGGEVARAYYGGGEGLDREALVERLYRSFTGRRPGRTELLSDAGAALVRAEIAAFVHELLSAGAAPADVPDLFYLLRRMGTWAGPTHGCVEWVKDTTSPLWTPRLLPQLLGLPVADRARELFHLRVLEQLAPELVPVPFEGGGGWPRARSPLRRRTESALTLARKAAAEGRRRLRRSRPAAAAAPDPFAAVQLAVREAVRSRPDHPAWQVLDRPRVERLLERDPASLDTMSRYYVWRLGQVFWHEPPN